MTDYLDIWYDGHDGLRLYARDYSTRCSDNSPIILCMHGLTRNSADFEDICEILANDYRLVVVDQRGRGNSTYDENHENYNPSVYVNDMFGLLKYLQISSVILMGTSMGGIMSMMMSAMQPSMFSAVIINDIGPEIDPEGLKRIQSYVGKAGSVTNWSEAAQQTKSINGHAFPSALENDWMTFAKRVYREDQRGCPVLAYDPAIAKPFAENQNTNATSLWPVFDAIGRVPLLLIRGELSDIISNDCVAKMQDRRPDMMYTEVPNVGHAPLLNEPSAVVAIQRFLQSMS